MADILHGFDIVDRSYRHDAINTMDSEAYTYDSLAQIKSLKRGAFTPIENSITDVRFMESWNFDKTGNWLQYDQNGVVEIRTHNKANELQGIATHDANGNMTTMPSPKDGTPLQCIYDAWNRLVKVGDGIEYSYNGQHQRVAKKVGAKMTHYFYNERWQELESQTYDEPGVASPVLTTYVWGLRYRDDLIFRERESERLYMISDTNWNAIALVDSSGTVVERMRYDAFGTVTWLDDEFAVKENSDYVWDRTFTGQVLDHETKLMLYRNRYYHPILGRFMSRDPIGYRGNDINLFRYVQNDPLVNSDPLGLDTRHNRQWRDSEEAGEGWPANEYFHWPTYLECYQEIDKNCTEEADDNTKGENPYFCRKTAPSRWNTYYSICIDQMVLHCKNLAYFAQSRINPHSDPESIRVLQRRLENLPSSPPVPSPQPPQPPASAPPAQSPPVQAPPAAPTRDKNPFWEWLENWFTSVPPDPITGPGTGILDAGAESAKLIILRNAQQKVFEAEAKYGPDSNEARAARERYREISEKPSMQPSL